MSNTIEYILQLNSNIESKLKRINIANDRQLETWSKVERQVAAATATKDAMGDSIGSLRERISALQAQREWIPASNKAAIRATNLEVKGLEKQVRRLESLNGGRFRTWLHQLQSAVPILRAVANPLMIMGVGVRQLTRYINASAGIFTAQATAQTKLAQVMHNTVGAGQEQVQMVLDLTKAQERLGVVSARTMQAGAQELAGNLTKTESIKQLIPAMNDLIARNHGLNATQEQAASVASMLGRVLNGESRQLKRYGFGFSEAQEKLLNYGTEAQRVATLIDIVSSSVGGVNAALAQTPEGRLQQHANEAANLQARVGELVVRVRAAILPIREYFLRIGEGVVSFFERFGRLIYNNAEHFKFLAQVVGIVTTAFVLYNSWAKITAAWTVLMTILKFKEAAAWWAALKPVLITAVVASAKILAIAAIIGLVISVVQSLRRNWESVTEAFQDGGLLAGLRRIGVVLLDAVLLPVQRLLEMLARIPGMANLAGRGAESIANLRNRLNVADPEPRTSRSLRDRVNSAVGFGSGSGSGAELGGLATANNAIATGGTRNTNVYITVGNMIGTLSQSGGVRENIQVIEREMAEGMLRILGMAEVSSN